MARTSKPNVPAKASGSIFTADELNSIDTAIDAVIDDHVSQSDTSAQALASDLNLASGKVIKYNGTELTALFDASGATATHAALTTGVHGVGAGTIAKTADITMANLAGKPFVTVGSNAGCDYVTDGVADQIQFNTAISTLTAGGSLLAKKATYNLAGSIVGSNLDNIHLLFEYGSQLVLGANMDLPAISLASCDNWLIENPPIDGQIATQTVATGSAGIGKIEYGILINIGCNNVILNPQIKDCGQVGIVIAGTGDYLTDNNKVLGGKITGCGWNGLTLESIDHAHPLYVTNTVVEGVDVSHCADVGLSSYGAYTKFQNNYIHDLDGVLGFNNARYGIALEGGGDSLNENNVIRDVYVGITSPYDAASATSGSNDFVNNRIFDTRYGIVIETPLNNLTGNKIIDWDIDQTGTAKGISITEDNNDVYQNYFASTSVKANAIYVGNADDCCLKDNRFMIPNGDFWSVEINTSDRTEVKNNTWIAALCLGISSGSDDTEVFGNKFKRSGFAAINDEGQSTKTHCNTDNGTYTA